MENVFVKSTIENNVMTNNKIIISDGGPCFGWRLSLNHPYQWISYDQALERSLNFGSGLVSMGLKPNSSSIVGIYSR